MPDPAGSSIVREETSTLSASRFRWLNWSGLCLAAVQSLCGAFIALHGVRLLVGIGAVVLASATWQLAEHLHVNAIRIPMMLVAFLFSVINLVGLWQVRRLRNRSASAWRQKGIAPAKRRSEALQLALSLLTLVLLLAELLAHHKLKGSF